MLRREIGNDMPPPFTVRRKSTELTQAETSEVFTWTTKLSSRAARFLGKLAVR